MHRISLIAAASIIAFGSVDAAERTAPKKNEIEPSAGAATSTAGDGASANRPALQAVFSSGATQTRAVAGTLISGASAPGLIPVTPFVTYAMTGDAAMDAELQQRLQDVHDREQRMMQNAEYRDLLRARQLVSLSLDHRLLPELMQISQEQADQLLNLLAEQRVREQAATEPMRQNFGDPAAVQEFMQKTQERQRANEAELLALLGSTKFQEWKEYEQSSMARHKVQHLQQTLPADARLRSDQLRPLVTAIWREQQRMFEEKVHDLPPNEGPTEEWLKRMEATELEQMTATNQRIVDATAPILSPRQLEHFKSLLQQELDARSQRQIFFGRMAPLPLAPVRR